MSEAARIDGYATALLGVAAAEGDQSALADQIFQVAQAFDGSEELRSALANPSIPFERKRKVVDDLLGGRAPKAIMGVVNMLISTGAISDFGTIARRALDLAATSQEAVVAEVRSAIDLDEATVARLAAKLSAVTNRKVKPQVIVDPTVIGGLSVKVGDTVFDGSVKSRIDDLREAWG